ncbi:branched-chain amino acid aminotransferase [[Actinobacillus] muris]|uniref:Branched-chain amino acid aminotransferase n=1 Tax=Muribacter muris TaxID=67855 RepID=A0A0J5P7I6_9PAST|nr:aminotransferase class IV family protein [Muribacter muris]KMK51444.1 branched-chain amino acid aminotransferase [[Actinobacillus] muris] [Muribacter muris]
MCQYPLFETIAIIDGVVQNIYYHQKRYEQAMRLYFNTENTVNLADIIHIPISYQTGIVRCKISYNASSYYIEFFPYLKREIDYFRCVQLNDAEYTFKYTDRQLFEQFLKKSGEELIFIKNGFISDCTIGNLLFLKNGIWHSPAHYLLKGTQLSQLIDKKQVILTEITQHNLYDYQQIMMINALNPFDPKRAIPINKNTIRC